MSNASVFSGERWSTWKISTIIFLLFSIIFPHHVLAAPYGGQVTSGSASINQSGTTTNINQSTNKASINWQGFSISSNETVNFNQPSASAMTLNRVVGNEKSVIAGALNANGKVYLINANGIVFNSSASVNVGGLVASTLNITDDDFNKGNFVFQGNGQSGQVINMGTIKATGDGKTGGYVALLGDQVRNEGVIVAERGTVSMNGAQKVTLNFNGDSLVNVSLDEGSLNALVETKGAIVTDGGKVILTAKAANALVESQVNVSGIVQARTLADLTGGSIEVYAHGGTATVAGTLDASAPNGGNGGTIETSGKTVKIADTAAITTKAASGQTGTWIIDPDGFTIAAYGGDITGATLATQLASNNVSIYSTQGSGTSGNIDVNDSVAWSANTILTLNATKAINVNAALSPTGTSGGIVLVAGTNIYLNTALALGSGSLTATAGGVINVNAPLSWTGSQTVALTAAGNINVYGTVTGSGGTLNLTSTTGNIEFDGVTTLGATTVNATAADDIDINAAFTWTGDTIATLTAGDYININAPLTATGTNAGLVMHYGTDYTIWTSASYSGTVLNSEGLPVAQTAPAGAVYGSVTLSGDNASLIMNGTKYTLIHSMDDLSSLYKLLDSTGTYYWNPKTQSYDIGKTKSAINTSGGVTYWWNTATQKYDIPDYSESLGKYYNPSNGAYTLSATRTWRASSYIYYYNIATGLYDTHSVYSGYGYSYNATTGLYDSIGKSGYYALVQNIDASGTIYTSSIVATFGGTLAGLGHTVSNLKINSTDSNIGLIGRAVEATTLRDIGVVDVAINDATIITPGSCVGALLGSSSESISISNAYSTGQVRGASQVGGLIGSISGSISKVSTITSSYSEADVTGTDGTAAGLIASGTYVTINKSDATGTVGAKSGAAGLIYTASATNVINSYATGDVTSSGNEAGGLIGTWQASASFVNSVLNSFATGNVTGGYTVGGLIASINGGDTILVDNCYATGMVTSNAPYSSDLNGVGGLIGFINSSGTITVSNSSASGDIVVNGDYVSNVGGLIGSAGGQSSPKAIYVTNTYSTSNVTATGAVYVGGLIGYAYKTFISDSFSTGDVVGSSVRSPGTSGAVAATGGLVGTLNNGGLDTSYASGTIAGYSAGGLAGNAAFSTDNNNYYNAESSSSAYGGSYGITGTGSSGLTTAQMEAQGMKTSGNFDPSAPSAITGTSPGQTAGTMAGNATAAAAANAESAVAGSRGPTSTATPTTSQGTGTQVPTNQYAQTAPATISAAQVMEQVSRVADGQQASASQPVSFAPVQVSFNTQAPSLDSAIRNFSSPESDAGGSAASFSAGIQTVTADGVTYFVEDSGSGGAGGGGNGGTGGAGGEGKQQDKDDKKSE